MRTVWFLHLESFLIQFLFIETLKFLKYVKSTVLRGSEREVCLSLSFAIKAGLD